jgi:hypothetical protein
MAERDISGASTAGGIPIDTSFEPALEFARAPRQVQLINMRVIYISAISVLIACAAGLIARALTPSSA